MVTQADQQAVASGLPDDDTMRVSHGPPMLVPASAGRVTHPTQARRCPAEPAGSTGHERPWLQERSSTWSTSANVPSKPTTEQFPDFGRGDLIIGKGGKSQIATLVERTSRYVMLIRIPYDRTAQRVAALLAQKMETLPDFLRNSVTWDQGKEMAAHASFTMKTGIDVYFCDPHSPWQRGTNENTNGLLRQASPKEPTCRATHKPNSTQSPTNSTTAHDRHSTGSNPPKSSTNSWSRLVVHPPY